jgi:hypothetical protein
MLCVPIYHNKRHCYSFEDIDSKAAMSETQAGMVIRQTPGYLPTSSKTNTINASFIQIHILLLESTSGVSGPAYSCIFGPSIIFGLRPSHHVIKPANTLTTTETDEGPGTPAGTIDSIPVPHEKCHADLKERVQHHHPYDKIKLSRRSPRCACVVEGPLCLAIFFPHSESRFIAGCKAMDGAM